MNYTIMTRCRVEVNTDPQRRCYHGCHASSELVWTTWEPLDLPMPEERVEARLQFWRDLNAGAVRARGESARREFKAVPSQEVHQ